MVAYKSLKTKEKSSWVIPKVVGVAYGRFLLQSLCRSSNGVAKVVVTRAGLLREWSQGGLRLYVRSLDLIPCLIPRHRCEKSARKFRHSHHFDQATC